MLLLLRCVCSDIVSRPTRGLTSTEDLLRPDFVVSKTSGKGKKRFPRDLSQDYALYGTARRMKGIVKAIKRLFLLLRLIGGRDTSKWKKVLQQQDHLLRILRKRWEREKGKFVVMMKAVVFL